MPLTFTGSKLHYGDRPVHARMACGCRWQPTRRRSGLHHAARGSAFMPPPSPCSAYMGKGVLTAVKNVNELIAPALIGMDPTKQVCAAPVPGWLRERAAALDLRVQQQGRCSHEGPPGGGWLWLTRGWLLPPGPCGHGPHLFHPAATNLPLLRPT